MKKVMIKLSTITDIRDFVSQVTLYDGDVDLSSGRYVVDGKSIMGIFSLDLLKPIEMTVSNDKTAGELLSRISSFIVK
ncbi:MAG TPA: hypothetical protein DCY74_07595 [Clostridiales bacterium]|jgi:phosphotransferase system HPr-like phosphotransfer protein|nr:hypothetical protein [Clostridiales bacterium]HCG35232.1 hypothetical protein [Clostridiales bacterium]